MKFALIGHPVSHSLSPVIHRAAYRELGLAHEYELIDAPTEADVARVVAAVRSGELGGVNVTIPWKRQAYAAADRHAVLAERLGVANVLARAGGQIIAHNTDALALEVEFKRLVATPRAIVLGSGGAAPAVVAAARAAATTAGAAPPLPSTMARGVATSRLNSTSKARASVLCAMICPPARASTLATPRRSASTA